MKLFNADALRPATDVARLSAANDLVQRTLAQHGLSQGAQPAEMPQFTLPKLDGLLARLKPSHAGTAFVDPLPDGATFENDTFTCHAGSREFRTYVPASASTGATGVVVMLHGCTQNPTDFAAGTGMNALAEKHGFVVVYPAQSRGDNAQSCWNWFSRGDQRRDSGEPAIIAGITRQVCDAHGIDRDRTFVAGLSAGAAMAVVLGETYPDVFAAVGAHSGLPYGSAKDVPSAFAAMAGNAQTPPLSKSNGATVRTIVFHGLADATVHPSNGDAIMRHALDKGAAQTIETTQAGNVGGRSYACRTSALETGAPHIEHWTIQGLGHAWSGGRPEGTYTDAKGPDASAEMIRFFFETTDGFVT